jgi:hypothetical protein
MTMQTIDTRAWHARYEALQALAGEELARGQLEPIGALTDAIEKAWGAVADTFKAHGAQASNSDPAEEVVAVLTRYLFLSNPNSEVLKHVELLIDAKVAA